MLWDWGYHTTNLYVVNTHLKISTWSDNFLIFIKSYNVLKSSTLNYTSLDILLVSDLMHVLMQCVYQDFLWRLFLKKLCKIGQNSYEFVHYISKLWLVSWEHVSLNNSMIKVLILKMIPSLYMYFEPITLIFIFCVLPFTYNKNFDSFFT